MESLEAVIQKVEMQSRGKGDYQSLVREMVRQFRTQMLLPSRDQSSFIATTPTGYVNIAAGAITTVASFRLSERYSGGLLQVGVNVAPPGSFGSVKWSIRSQGFIHSGYQNLVFVANTLATPLRFQMEILNGRSIDLVAQNAGDIGVDVAGVLIGYQEELTEWKHFGSQPASGVG